MKKLLMLSCSVILDSLQGMDTFELKLPHEIILTLKNIDVKKGAQILLTFNNKTLELKKNENQNGAFFSCSLLDQNNTILVSKELSEGKNTNLEISVNSEKSYLNVETTDDFHSFPLKKIS